MANEPTPWYKTITFEVVAIRKESGYGSGEVTILEHNSGEEHVYQIEDIQDVVIGLKLEWTASADQS